MSAARAGLLPDLDAVQAAVTALDDADRVCAGGAGQAAQAATNRAAPLAGKARRAITALRADVTTYRGALTELGRSETAVGGVQRAALAQVVTQAGAEAAAAERFRSTAAHAWPTYEALKNAEQLWVTRDLAGWFRSTREAADAYAVLVRDRPALDAARQQLATASAELVTAGNATAAALTAADRALA